MLLRRHKKPDALQGTLDLLVLTTLSRGPHHGYGIAADIQSISDDILRVEEGSLYPALHRMEHLGWITAEWQTTDEQTACADLHADPRRAEASGSRAGQMGSADEGRRESPALRLGAEDGMGPASAQHVLGHRARLR